uniref:Transmembrane channel-like protein n=1 Tax=Xiphophorus couchianus TaxID=32473 RepID=A0A3B5M6N3_9TELE
MCSSGRSPADEEGVHDSFSQLIAEESQKEGPSDAIELQYQQRNPEDKDRGTPLERASIKDFARSARPSIRGYGVEVDTTDSAGKKQERLIQNLQNLSAVDRVRLLKEMPLNLSEKKSLRRLTLQMTKQTRSSSNLRCCSYLKFHIILALRHSWYNCLSFLHSLHLWQMPLKRVSGRFGSGVLSYFLFLKTLLFFNMFLFLVLGSFLVVPQAVYPPEQLENRKSFTGLELFTGGGYFANTLLYYGYYSNHTLHSCSKNNISSPPKPECDSKSLSYNMPLLYRFLIIDFIFTLLATLFGELLWRSFSDKVLKRNRRPGFDIAKNVLDLIYGQTLAWLGLLFAPLLPAVQILKLLLLFYIKMSSVMMNCQAPSRAYRVSQMTTIFITLLCFPSFLGASVCVTYTMWRLPSSESCGPFRGNKTMIQAGKQRIVELVKENPNLYFLAEAHTYLVENPLVLFVGATIFLIVIYFQSQVVDGQRKIIALLQEQIENEGEDKKFLITRLQSVHERKRTPARNLTSQVSLWNGRLV